MYYSGVFFELDDSARANYPPRTTNLGKEESGKGIWDSGTAADNIRGALSTPLHVAYDLLQVAAWQLLQ